jgi:hypothetical protein
VSRFSVYNDRSWPACDRYASYVQDATGTSVGDTLADALNDSTLWPPAAASGVGQPVTISATYPFTSAISMFWPGAGQGVRPYQTVNFPAASTEKIQF